MRVFEPHCFRCHSGENARGGLNLTTFKKLDAAEVITAGSPEKSILYQYVQTDQMPPDRPLPSNDKQLIYDWIKSGARK